MSHLMAHHEPPHQDLPCLQIHLVLSLELKELMLCQSMDPSPCLIKELHCILLYVEHRKTTQKCSREEIQSAQIIIRCLGETEARS